MTTTSSFFVDLAIAHHEREDREASSRSEGNTTVTHPAYDITPAEPTEDRSPRRVPLAGEEGEE